MASANSPVPLKSEMGEVETRILLTSTTSVPRMADALISYMLALPANENVLSIYPMVHPEDKVLTRHVELLSNDAISPLFLPAIDATEKAVYNSVFRATTATGQGH